MEVLFNGALSSCMEEFFMISTISKHLLEECLNVDLPRKIICPSEVGIGMWICQIRDYVRYI